MNTTEWVTRLVANAALSKIPQRVVAHAVLYLENGEGWLAAWDLLDAGLEEGWLSDADLDIGIDFSDDGAFGRISAGLGERLRAERDRRAVSVRADSA